MIKNCQTIKVLSLVFFVGGLGGCQNKPIPNKNNKATNTTKTYQALIVQNVKKFPILLVNTKWNITKIHQHSALAFNNQPYLYLLQQSNQVMGSTGCNQLTGSYHLKPSGIEFDTKAGYEYCENALAQEAELMDGLARVRRYQMSQNTLTFYDAQGLIVIQAIAQ